MQDFEFINRFLKNLSGFLGEKCEVVIHDFSSGYENTIVFIENSITGRSLGDPPTNLFFEGIKSQGDDIADIEPYITVAENGVVYKSFTTFLRDKNGKVTGAVCVNMDVSEQMAMLGNLQSFLQVDKKAHENELYVKDLNELVDHYLAEIERIAGKKAAEMDKSEKLEALRYLDEKGVLNMSKSSQRLCELFEFSKFTLYKYLEEIREN